MPAYEKIFVSSNPKIMIRKRTYDSIVDLDMLKTEYNINEEGAKIITEKLKELEPYIDKSSKRYFNYIPSKSMNIKINNDYAEYLANFLLKVVTDERYIEKGFYR